MFKYKNKENINNNHWYDVIYYVSQQHGLNCQPDKFKKSKKNEIVDCIIKKWF